MLQEGEEGDDISNPTSSFYFLPLGLLLMASWHSAAPGFTLR